MQNKERRVSLVFGIFVILMGILTLIQNIVAPEDATWLWIAGLFASALAFGWAFTYEKELWAAIGTYVCATLAIVIFFITKVAVSGVIVPIIVLLAIAFPFVLGWWFNREQWGLLVPAYVMVAIIPVLFMDNIANWQPQIVPAYTLLAISLPFWVGYSATRKAGLLVPGGILLLLSLAFFAVSFGLSVQILTVVVPIAAIVAGAFLLFHAWSSDVRKQQ